MEEFSERKYKMDTWEIEYHCPSPEASYKPLLVSNSSSFFKGDSGLFLTPQINFATL